MLYKVVNSNKYQQNKAFRSISVYLFRSQNMSEIFTYIANGPLAQPLKTIFYIQRFKVPVVTRILNISSLCRMILCTSLTYFSKSELTNIFTTKNDRHCHFFVLLISLWRKFGISNDVFVLVLFTTETLFQYAYFAHNVTLFFHNLQW